MRALLICLMLLTLAAPAQAQSRSDGSNGVYVPRSVDPYARPQNGLTFPDGKYVEPYQGPMRNGSIFPDEDGRRGAVQSDGLGSNVLRFRAGWRL